MTRLEDLLARGAKIVSVPPTATVRDAAKAMADANCGSTAVLDGERMVGIFTERDLMKRVLLQDQNVDQVRVAEVMSTQLVFAKPKDSVGAAIVLMRKHHIRHLPVVDMGGALLGVLSIRDLIREEVKEMRDYIALSEG